MRRAFDEIGRIRGLEEAGERSNAIHGVPRAHRRRLMDG